ncbi:hypothetical protein HDU97_007890 [Phlyctochytrium planicorne]|nr:hypothetical protein HDU97_007890 [Phlyctochytrium planicorne]
MPSIPNLAAMAAIHNLHSRAGTGRPPSNPGGSFEVPWYTWIFVGFVGLGILILIVFNVNKYIVRKRLERGIQPKPGPYPEAPPASHFLPDDPYDAINYPPGHEPTPKEIVRDKIFRKTVPDPFAPSRDH